MKQLHNVKHDFIRYANCWEDADILLKGLAPKPAGQILSIGSAGDNSFSLLTTDPTMVVAVDINKVQLFLIELKKSAIKTLDYPDFLEFLGFVNSNNRLKLFNSIKQDLTGEAKSYWEYQISNIESGLIYTGKFEKYFSIFSKKILPLVHSRKTIDKHFEEKSEDEQREFYFTTWNNWRWRLLFKLFFSRAVMGKFGRDPAFLKQVEVTVSEHIFGKAESHLITSETQQNYFLKFILTGSFNGALPHYAREENFKKIKANIERIEIFEGFAETAFKKYDRFNYLNLSNIFEYMDESTFKNVTQGIIDATDEGAKFAYWNLMVPRRFSSAFPDHFQYHREESDNLSSIDKCFFYNCFVVDERR